MGIKRETVLQKEITVQITAGKTGKKVRLIDKVHKRDTDRGWKVCGMRES